MHKRLIRVLLGLGMTLALVSAGSPAQAQSSVVVQFTGYATISPGLVLVEDRTAAFSFTATVCTDVTAGVKKGEGTGPCQLKASGTLTGRCGATTGTGIFTVTTHDGHTYTGTITITSTGGNIEIVITAARKTGSTQTGAGAGVATATPSQSTGGALSCNTAAGATRYDILNGEVTLSIV